MTEEKKPVPMTVSLEHGVEPLQQSNHHLLTAGAEGLPVRMHLSHLSYPESFCVLLPPTPAASQKQHSCFHPGHLPEKTDWSSCASQVWLLNFPELGAKNLLTCCQNIPLTKHSCSHTWILIPCFSALASSAATLTDQRHRSALQLARSPGLQDETQSPFALHLSHAGLLQNGRERRNISTEINTIAKRRETPMDFWWKLAIRTAMHSATVSKDKFLFPRNKPNSLFPPTFCRYDHVHPSPQFCLLQKKQPQHLHFLLTVMSAKSPILHATSL